MSTILEFQQYWGYATANVACRLCGKVSKRRVKDYGTVNPYNRNDDGTIRTPAQVQARAQANATRMAKAQEDGGRICRVCEAEKPA